MPSGGSAGTPGIVEPNAFIRSGDWHGWLWNNISSNGTISPPDFSGAKRGGPYCVSGKLPAGDGGWAQVGVNLNEEVEGGSIDSVVPTQNGIVINVTNPGATRLRAQLASSDGQGWCTEISGGGGYYRFDQFNTNCWDNSGTYYAKQPIASLAVVVPGRNGAETAFNYCLVRFYEANSGVSRACDPARPNCNLALIDDFEGAYPALYEQDGRSGLWYAYDDETGGTRSMAVEAATGGGHALHITGSGFTGWGAGNDAYLNRPPGAELKHAYDASRYSGITFRYKSKTDVFVQLPTLSTVSSKDEYVAGGKCPHEVADCGVYQAALKPAAEWTSVTLAFSQFEVTWGLNQVTGAPRADEIISFGLKMPSNSAFDVWLDDVSFF